MRIDDSGLIIDEKQTDGILQRITGDNEFWFLSKLPRPDPFFVAIAYPDLIFRVYDDLVWEFENSLGQNWLDLAIF